MNPVHQGMTKLASGAILPAMATYGPAPLAVRGFDLGVQNVPRGTTCGMIDGTGQSASTSCVPLSPPTLRVSGNANKGHIRCTFPDGAADETHWNKTLTTRISSSFVRYRSGTPVLPVVERAEEFERVFPMSFVRVQ